MAYLARTLGPEGFGQIGWAAAAYTFAVNFGDLGLQMLGIRTIAQNPRDLAETVSDIVSLRACLGTLALLGLLVFASLSTESPVVKLLTVFYGLGILCSIFLLEWVFTGLQQMRFVGLSQVIHYATYAGILFVLLHDPDQILILPIAGAAGILVSVVVLGVLFRQRYPTFAFRPNPRRWLSLLRQAVPFGASNVIVQLYVSLPILMLGWFMDDAAVGYYNGAYRVMLIPYELIGMFLLTLNPAVADRWKNAPETVGALLSAVLRIVVTLTVPIAIGSLVVGPQVLALVLGHGFESSGLVFQILTWNLLVVGVTGMYTQLALNMNGQQGRTLVVVAAGAVVSILLDLVLIPAFSYVGASVALVGAQSVLCVLAFFIARRYVSIPFWPSFLKASWHRGRWPWSATPVRGRWGCF